MLRETRLKLDIRPILTSAPSRDFLSTATTSSWKATSSTHFGLLQKNTTKVHYWVHFFRSWQQHLSLQPGRLQQQCYIRASLLFSHTISPPMEWLWPSSQCCFLLLPCLSVAWWAEQLLLWGKPAWLSVNKEENNNTLINTLTNYINVTFMWSDFILHYSYKDEAHKTLSNK